MPTSLRLSILFACAITLAGCTTVGPDYDPPAVDWRDKWETELYKEIGSAADQAKFDLRFWWRLFDDPVLNRLIELARQANPSLRIAGLRVLESRAALGIARSSQYPQLQQLNGDVTFAGTKPRGEQSQGDVTAGMGVVVGWELDFWGRFKRSIESADAAFFASIANQQDFQVLLAAQVTSLYYDYRTTLLRIDIARRNADIQKRSYEITKQLFEAGVKSELDLQQALTQYMSTLSSIPGLEISRRQLRNALGALLGRPPGGLPELDDEARKLPMVEPLVVKEVPAQLLLRRPDMRAAAAQVAAQTALVGVAEAEKYPSISLLGNVGWSSSTMRLGVGPAFTWDIFSYGRIKNKVRVQDARLEQAIEGFQDTALQAVREVDDAAVSVVKTREQRDPQRQSLLAAVRSLELANSRYGEGYADFQRVLEAQRSLSAQSDRDLVNQNNHIGAVVAFYKAVGGGWLEMAVDELVPESTRETMERRTDWGDLLRAPLPAGADAPSFDVP